MKNVIKNKKWLVLRLLLCGIFIAVLFSSGVIVPQLPRDNPSGIISNDDNWSGSAIGQMYTYYPDDKIGTGIQYPQPLIEYTLNLHTGWNLITIPVENTYTAESLCDEIFGCSVILTFNALNQTYLTHVVNTPWDNFPIENGHGYFVYVTSNTTFTVTGTPIETVTVDIHSGWNIIGWFHFYNTTAESLSQQIEGCTVISMFDAITQTFVSHITKASLYNFIIETGMACHLYTTQETIWYGEG